MTLNPSEFQTDEQRFALLMAREYLRVKRLPLMLIGQDFLLEQKKRDPEHAPIPWCVFTESDQALLAEMDRVIAVLTQRTGDEPV